MAENKVFLRQDNDYRTMKVFRKAECIYDVTYYFAYTFLKPGDRTIDQMIQAARSGKQNLAEGTIDGVTSREKIRERSDETIANIAITLIHQCDVLLRGMIEWMKRDFIENGGIKEEMYRARKDWQRRNGMNGSNGFDGSNRSNGPSQPNQPIRPIEPNKPKKD